MENKIRILLAEDDVNLGKVLSEYLKSKGYLVQHANNGEVAYDMFCADNFDICLVDVMMPLKDGFTLAKEIRKADKHIPIIFLTAKSQQEDMIEGLSIGGDDYITKPFSMEVLVARIQALMRRTMPADGEAAPTKFQLGSISFDSNMQTLTYADGKEVKLTTREAELLIMFINRKNELVERDYVLRKIWGDDSYYNARSMDVYLTKLRKHFKDDPSVQIINVHGKGFKLVM